MDLGDQSIWSQQQKSFKKIATEYEKRQYTFRISESTLDEFTNPPRFLGQVTEDRYLALPYHSGR
jgi:hypothetical protein